MSETPSSEKAGIEDYDPDEWMPLLLLPAGVLVLFSSFWLDMFPMVVRAVIGVLGLTSGVVGALASPLSEELRRSPIMAALFVFATTGFLVYPLEKLNVDPMTTLSLLAAGTGVSLVLLAYGVIKTANRWVKQLP